ncbi:PREDICTED: uncharacterized protein LOC108568798 [Nicrophorus vespilloides]|uniref:Uncharacterized protein LOC108568798 n=1 Tax=Nicrophorus vespilloides TaxID=110193 RepID=A0ABM1NFH7_NICVS|nr:PREDICTED: uncharacterized protein LOC108568798 [Nicrophorus vespilloides]
MSRLQQSLESGMKNESKHYNMKHFIDAVNEYIKTRTEDSANLINRHLQLLSVVIDISVFDPNTSIVCEFFVSLHELLNILEPRSTIAWCCVNVLAVACRNSAARHALIHTYQFIPALSRLLGDHLMNNKRTQLLLVMQDLSCGIKISWMIPHLPHLMTVLTRWVANETEDEQVISLSLGVLVNLCYKNLPAIYTLTRCMDIKKFLRVCNRLEGAMYKINVCKLMIILDRSDIYEPVPEETFVKLISATFQSVLDTLRVQDAILMRSIVEFFLDVKQQNNGSDSNILNIFTNIYTNYKSDVELILEAVENNNKGDAGNQLDPECMSIVFRFVHSLIELKLPNLVPLYARMVYVALRWVETEVVSYEALRIVRTVATSSKLEDMQLFEPLMKALPVFMIDLQHIDEDTIMNIEHCRRLSSVMELFTALLKVEHTKQTVVDTLNEDLVCKIFVPLIGSSPRLPSANNCTPEAITLYIHTFALINEIACIKSEWVTPLQELLQYRQIHMVIAEALFKGNEDIKALILTLAGFPLFPHRQVAIALQELQPLMKADVQKTTSTNDMMSYPITSVAQAEKLDRTIDLLKEACEKKHIVNISTSQVMELYEYKLASMQHAERASMASVEAASKQCIHLQQRTAQLSAELSRIRQLLLHTQQNSEDAARKNKKYDEHIRELNDRLNVIKGKHNATKSQVEQRDQALAEKATELEEVGRKVAALVKQREALEQTNAKLNAVAEKLNESLKRQEAHAEKKEEIIKKANASIEHYKMESVQLQRQLNQLDVELKRRSDELSAISEELQQKTKLINTITKLTTSK